MDTMWSVMDTYIFRIYYNEIERKWGVLSKKFESKEFWSIMMILDSYEKNWEKERKHVNSKRVEIFRNLWWIKVEKLKNENRLREWRKQNYEKAKK